jgi:hypothetical protein
VFCAAQGLLCSVARRARQIESGAEAGQRLGHVSHQIVVYFTGVERHQASSVSRQGCFDPNHRLSALYCPLAQPGYLAVEIATSIVRGHSGIEAKALDRSRKGGFGGDQDGPLVQPDCGDLERARMEPPVRGLRVDALASCPLGQVHLRHTDNSSTAKTSIPYVYIAYVRSSSQPFQYESYTGVPEWRWP